MQPGSSAVKKPGGGRYEACPRYHPIDTAARLGGLLYWLVAIFLAQRLTPLEQSLPREDSAFPGWVLPLLAREPRRVA